MKFIQSIPQWLCALCLLIMWMRLDVNILSLIIIFVFLFGIGYSINRIPIRFPEDESEPYFQFRLNIFVIILFSIVSVIGTVSLLNVGEFNKCAYFIWVYFNVISGYFSSEFDKA